jgi:hypothetical protein
MAREEAKRKARNGDDDEANPLISGEDILAEVSPEDADEGAADAEAEEDEGPDLLLREAARIAADMAGFSHDMGRLEHAFSQLRDGRVAPETIN